MGKTEKKPTFRYFVSKDDKKTNMDDLTPEERDMTMKWAYQTLVKNLGYQPVMETEDSYRRCI